MMEVGLGLVALAFGGLWWAEITGRACECPGCGTAVAGDDDSTLPDREQLR